MAALDSEYPWVYYRDEIDLLEDQIEDLFERHDASLTDTLTMEQEVLQEQLKTEEVFEQSLANGFGRSVFLFGDSISASESDSSSSQNGMDHELSVLRKEVVRQPLYRIARAWAASVYTFTHQRYEHDAVRSRELFCAYANVNLVPIKLSVALIEEMRGDTLGIDMAIQEYKLTSIYLGRVADSLEHAVGQELDSAPVIEMIGVARQLLGGLAKRIRDLENRKTSGGRYEAQ
jgi:hypothetical protein